MQDIVLQAGVNAQMTLALNTAGINVSNLIRYKSGLVEKLGGWQLYYPYQFSLTPIRDIHVFQSLRGTQYVAAGALNKLGVIASGALTDITPQGFQSSPTPSFDVTAGGNVVTVRDTGSCMTAYGTVRFDTPVAIAGLLLSGAYPVNSVIDQNTYTILVPTNSSATVSSGGILPKFWCSSGVGTIDVELPNNGYLNTVGLLYPFRAPTNVGGVTIQGPYQVTTIFDSTDFAIGSPTPTTSAVSSGSPVSMNGGLASIYHYVVQGPPVGAPYGAGSYGTGPYGYGVAAGGGPAPPITVTDWELDNWGQNLIACQQNGPIFVWSPDVGLSVATPIVAGNAPQFNAGAFVSKPQQILFAWGSCNSITQMQDPLMIRWSDIGAQQGYAQWNVTTTSYAGSFRIPSGSAIKAAIQSPLTAVFLTDVDAWTANYIGLPIVWSFLQIAYGCGCIGEHAITIQNGVTYWVGQANFYALTSNGIQSLPCSVWDFFFQQLDRANQSKVRMASNSAFSEITTYFPVIGGTGENSAYVKVHIEGQEYQWDYGFLDRTAWTDVSIVGMPIGSDDDNFIYQHETSNDANGTPINAAIETGYFTIGDSSELAFVNWVLPDAKWAPTGSGAASAQLTFTFFAADYAGQLERIYGPYSVTQGVPSINCRMRGRFWRMRVESTDLGSFWRFGRLKFRWSPFGRR
jgi:hypothetical protein